MGSAATPLGNMVIKLGLDDADFGKGVANTKKQISYLSKEMSANMKVADLAGNGLGKLKTNYDGLTQIIGAQEKQVAGLTTAYKNSFDENGNATNSTFKYANQLQDANGKLANYKLQLEKTAGAYADLSVRTTGWTGELNTFGDAAINAGGKLQTVGKGMSNLGGKMTTGITLPLAGVAVAATSAAISWESAFTGVKKTNDEVIDSNGNVTYSYSDLETGLRNLAKELPSTHEDIAAVAEAAGQLGIQTDNVVEFTKVMIDMGESTNLSAETAATELARFANITGMSQDKFSNLGAAIVDLGNNFATTESEISAMALRLAGAGSQIGMSEGDILGLSTALSSVGIEAEAGGSAFSKVMVNMQLAVENGMGSFDELIALGKQSGVSFEEMSKAAGDGGKNLKATASQMGLTSKEFSAMYKEADTAASTLVNFSDVAGMTNAEFGNLFKENPAEAIMKFVEGLGHAEEKGTSAIKVLDDMDITEVRLRDSLLRAANASGIFSDAVSTGNKAFSENTALTKEAGKRYETTESKLKALKNEVKDAAIDLGGPLVDALRDGVEASKPLIKGLGDLAKSFSSLDKEQQQNILKWGAVALAAGPTLKLFGNGIETIGSVTKGIGGLSKSFVDLAAKSAAKSTVANLTTQMTAAGTAAAGASGSAGIGALTTSIGGLAAALPAIVGVGGLLAVGYGAWKMFGEEAWNSGQRVKQWGTDVGSEVDKTLDNVKIKTESATGQFGLLSSGVSTNTGEMVTNFSAIGTSIEDSLNKKILGLDGLLKALPETVSETMRQIIEDEKALTETSLESVAENNTRIKEMREKASNENRELTVSEAKQIQDLSTKSAEAYVETLDVSAEQKKVILKSMTADVSSATKEEASLMMQSLGEQYNAQQSHYAQSRTEQEKWLKDWGYNLDGEFAQKYLDEWDKMNEATGDGFLNQMALIKEKYPELQNEVHMGSGQLIEEAVGAGQMLIEDNERLMSSVANMGDRLAENARKNADQISLTAEAGTAAGDMWNSLELLDKNGEIKTNAQETVNEAANSEASWNQMQWLVKDADVSSNIKMMIAEAAIANGQWENMSFTDQQAMLDSNITQEMTQALQASGDWSELTFDEKKAIIYSNTPETMAQTMSDLGLWNNYEPAIKELNATNFDFLASLAQSTDALGIYNLLSPDVKTLLGENPVNITIEQARQILEGYNGLQPDQKDLLGQNAQIKEVIASAEASIAGYDSISPELKTLLATSPADLTVEQSRQILSGYNNLKPEQKTLLGQNAQVNGVIDVASQKVRDYEALNPKSKTLLGQNSQINSTLETTKNNINLYNQKIVDSKKLGIDNSENWKIGDTQTKIDNMRGKSIKIKVQQIMEKLNGPQYASGTSYHKGGPALVNDQKGPMFKELIALPSGKMFIPQMRNTLLNLPRGSKVLPAKQTKKIVPHYADGIGIPGNSSLIKNLRPYESNQNIIVNQTNYDDKLDKIISVMSHFSSDLKNLKLILDTGVLAGGVNTKLGKAQELNERGI